MPKTMTDTFELTLNNPLTEEQWDTIADVDFDHTDRIWFHTKHGKEVEFAKVIRCKDCKKYFPKTADRDSYCPFVGRIGLEPDGYCAWAERKTDHD